ncbi:MAG: hypothetical protein K2H31_10330, partial [Lachnospiraceae bacterium]|nr:hypothetical protein [Lachnospiraceae bacterium]
MKKWLIILGIITCMAGLTACGKQEQDAENLLSNEEALELAENWAVNLDTAYVTQQESNLIAYYVQYGLD